MDKPRPGKTTFVIMVSPLPGKYELLPNHRPAPSSSSHSKRTVTSLAPPPHPPPLRVPRPGLAHPGNNLRNLHVSTRGTLGPGGSGTGRLCAPLIYIRHAPAGMSRMSCSSDGARDLLTPPETRWWLVRGARGRAAASLDLEWEPGKTRDRSASQLMGWVGTRV